MGIESCITPNEFSDALYQRFIQVYQRSNCGQYLH